MAIDYTPKHFTLTYPREYVAHIETNRPEKMNAYHEACVLSLP